MAIKLRDDVVFENPESRIREYCDIEVYWGYDDKHSINNEITLDDIDAANKLYAMIDRYDKTESSRLLNRSIRISNLLSSIPNTDIYDISDEEWLMLRSRIGKLLVEVISIKGIRLAKATKILHLKRPNLFPVLDSFVISFLMGVNSSEGEKRRQADIGLRTLDHIRQIMIQQRDAFKHLVRQTRDRPIPLTPVRLFDILCWTAEKWDIRGILSAPYGVPTKSLLASSGKKAPALASKQTKTPFKKVDRTNGKYVVFEDLEKATGPKVHHKNCFYYQRWLANPTTTTTWHGPYETKEESWEVCKKLASKSGFKPSEHSCVRQL